MTERLYGISDFYDIAAGAAIFASGGGGSYQDAITILDALADSGWEGSVPVRDYDGVTDACVLAIMGSPDAADAMTLDDVQRSILNTLNAYTAATDIAPTCAIPVEIGPINSLVPLIAAAMGDTSVAWVVNGDGAGRAVPELPQTTFGGATDLAVSPCVLADDTDDAGAIQSVVLNAPDAARAETLAGGAVSAFGSFSGIALWPSNESNDYALSGNYIPDTLEQTRALGAFLSAAETPPSTAEVASFIAELTGRVTTPLVTNFYITSVTQSTTSASLDTGIIRLDNSAAPHDSTETHYIYNLNENLIMYSSLSTAPDAIAPDSICYYSENTGAGFSNAMDDLALYFDASTGQSTGRCVSVIKIAAEEALYEAPGVVSSFAGLLREIGYAGAMPYPAT
ncbi:MAG: DUF917 family protein [Pseudomonadota bacterium]